MNTRNITVRHNREIRKPYHNELDEMIAATKKGGFTEENTPSVQLKPTEVQTARKYAIAQGMKGLKTYQFGDEETAEVKDTTVQKTTAWLPEAEEVAAKEKAKLEKEQAKEQTKAEKVKVKA